MQFLMEHYQSLGLIVISLAELVSLVLALMGKPQNGTIAGIISALKGAGVKDPQIGA